MKKSRIRLNILVVVVLLMSFSGCKLNLKVDFSEVKLGYCRERVGNQIKNDKWQLIHIGMKKYEIKKILGPPIEESVIVVNGQIQYEYWEYEYYGGIKNIPSEKFLFVKEIKGKDYWTTVYSLKDLENSMPCINAHTIYFDQEDQAISLKKPRLNEYKATFNEKNWDKLKMNLNKDEVLKLVGEPLSITKNMKKENNNYSEYWEYKDTNHFVTLEPNIDAYVVFFDNNGLLKTFQEPLAH